jgi:hypothetical protein
MPSNLTSFLRYENRSHTPFYAILSKELGSININDLPFKFDETLFQKMSYNSGLGTVIITNNTHPFMFLNTTIESLFNFAQSNNITVPAIPTNELIIKASNGHMSAVLQFDDQYTFHSFYPNLKEEGNKFTTGSLASSTKNCKLESLTSSSDLTASGNYLKSSHNDKDYFNVFKVTENQAQLINKTIYDIALGCETQEILYNFLPSTNNTENCFTSINRLTTVAQIEVPYFKFFFDYQFNPNLGIGNKHFYHVKHEGKFSLIEKAKDYIAFNSELIFMAVSYFLPFTTPIISTLLDFFSSREESTKNETEIVTDSLRPFEIVPCHYSSSYDQKSYLTEQLFKTCIREVGPEIIFQAQLSDEGILYHKTEWYIPHQVEESEQCFEYSCIVDHIHYYHNNSKDLVGEFLNHTYAIN